MINMRVNNTISISDAELCELQLNKFSERMSICIDCANATGNCSWSQSFTPVKGWKATPSKYVDNGHKVLTYKVCECPLFKPDRPHKYGYQISIETLSRLCGTRSSSISRWTVNKINKKLRVKHSDLEVIWYRDPVEEEGSFYLRKCP